MIDPKLAESTAYHEAGHIVVAAVLKRPINSHGIHIDCVDRGVSFFQHREPKGHYHRWRPGPLADTIVALYAGFIAQRRFYSDAPEGCAAGDNDVMGKLLNDLEPDDPPELASEGGRSILAEKANDLVTEHWRTIEKVAQELWAAPCTHRDRLKRERSFDWSERDREKMLDGDSLKKIMNACELYPEIWDPPQPRSPSD